MKRIKTICPKILLSFGLGLVGLICFSSQIKADTNTVDFTYDAGGQRVSKVVTGGDHTYYVSPGVEVIVSPDGTVSWRKNYTFNGKLIAVKEGNSASQTLSYIHQDHLGSTNMVTNDQGTVVGQQTYFPYGATREEDGTSPTERQYTGQISDQDLTGLYYYNARYYNPTLAKFTQPDSQGDTLNKYAYVGNNPTIFTDPTGNYMDPWGGGGGGSPYTYNIPGRRGGTARRSNMLLFPWDASKYSYESTGQDPILSFLYENPTYNLGGFLSNSRADYTGVDVKSIYSDYIYLQNHVLYTLGMAEDPFGGELSSMLNNELISAAPAAIPSMTKLGAAFIGKLRSFVSQLGVDQPNMPLILDVGAADNPSFSNAITLDINPSVKPTVIGDANALPFASGTFDIVTQRHFPSNVITKNPGGISSELARVAKSGGQVSITSLTILWPSDSPYPIYPLNMYYDNLTKSGLTLEQNLRLSGPLDFTIDWIPPAYRYQQNYFKP